MFDLNKCATAIATAMVGTIRSGDDANRFSQRAVAEGFSNISDLIASDAAKQAVAIRNAVAKLDGINVAVKVPAPAQEVTITAAPLDAPAPPAAEVESTTSTSTTLEIAGTVDLDSEGLPWDGRIHSSSKKKLASNGKWQLRRNIDPNVVSQVEAELRQVMAIPVPSATAEAVGLSPLNTGEAATIAPPPPVETQGLHPDSNAFSVGTVNTLTAAGNAVPPVGVSAPAASAGSSKPYAEYNLADLMRGITAKRILPADVTAVVAQFGVPSVPALAAKPDLIPMVAEALAL